MMKVKSRASEVDFMTQFDSMHNYQIQLWGANRSMDLTFVVGLDSRFLIQNEGSELGSSEGHLPNEANSAPRTPNFSTHPLIVSLF